MFVSGVSLVCHMCTHWHTLATCTLANTCASTHHCTASEPDESTVPGTDAWLAAADYQGPVKILQYRGIGQPRAYWDRAFAALYRGRLYVFSTRGSAQVLAVHQVWNQQRTLRVSPDAAHGHAHVLAVAGADARAADGIRALHQGGALVFRTVTEAQVGVEYCSGYRLIHVLAITIPYHQEHLRYLHLSSSFQADGWQQAMVQSQRIMVELAGMTTEDAAGVPTGDDASSLAGSGAESAEAKGTAPHVVVSAALGELLVVVSGRTVDAWWPALDVR